MDKIYVTPYKLRRLRGVIETGIFAVPELQREFVWNARKACDLLDSIYKHYPIGTVLIWKTGRRNEHQLRKQLHILPHYNPANSHIYFLIDGQQRLSVLWHFLRGQAQTVVNADGKELDFGSVYFDPYADPTSEPLFVYRRRVSGELANRLVSVVDMLSPRWRVRVGSHGIRAMRRIEDCRDRIERYSLLAVFCETSDRAEVRETFVRVNSLGMRIGTADRAFARASRFNMRGMVRDAQSRLKNGFHGSRRTTILQTIALAMGSRDLGQRAIDSLISRLESDSAERVKFTRLWPKLRESFGVAVDFFISDLRVANFGFLPSEPMLTILTLFFFHNNNRRPSKAEKKRLVHWFWATATGARYTGRGYRPNLLADAAFVERLASSARAQGTAFTQVPLHVLRTTDYSRPGPLSNAFFCLLRANRPKYLEDGAEILLGDISSRRNRRDKHHIFPRGLLNRHGIGADRYNSILNICYLVARENQSIGQRAPRHYLADVPRNGHSRRSAMRSHFIPTNSGVWDPSVKRGFRTFLDERTSLLVRAFEQQAGQRLFERRT